MADVLNESGRSYLKVADGHTLAALLSLNIGHFFGKREFVFNQHWSVLPNTGQFYDRILFNHQQARIDF